MLALIMLVAFVAVASFNILYTNHINRQSDQTWCDLITSLDERNQRAAGTVAGSDPDAIKFRRQVHDIRERLSCPGSSPQPRHIPSTTPFPPTRR